MELNREQIIKMLETIDYVGDCSRDCIFYNGKVHSCGGTIAKHALALINELTEENERLKELLDREAKCQYDLATQIMDLLDDVKYFKSDTVLKTLQDVSLLFSTHFGTYTRDAEIKVFDVFKLLDRITEELLEGIGGD